ncbi:MAG TPA: hypothetical protein PKE05_18415, partial [Microthrixaceae bacterium]|nr:hypothetical protein [Microthrixaceae bacterium]
MLDEPVKLTGANHPGLIEDQHIGPVQPVSARVEVLEQRGDRLARDARPGLESACCLGSKGSAANSQPSAVPGVAGGVEGESLAGACLADDHGYRRVGDGHPLDGQSLFNADRRPGSDRKHQRSGLDRNSPGSVDGTAERVGFERQHLRGRPTPGRAFDDRAAGEVANRTSGALVETDATRMCAL